MSLLKRIFVWMALIGSIGISAGCEAPIPVDTADPLWAIPAQYSFALSFSGGVAAAQKSDSQWVFLDKTGEDVFDESFVQVDYQFSQYPGFMNGLAIVHTCAWSIPHTLALLTQPS